MKMPNKVYDILKWMALVFLPALSTFTFVVFGIWNLSCGEQIVGTIAAIETFLGVILGISSSKYKKNISTSENIDVDN